eukprot:1146989-Pelagomonas_calceolata.AAC.3
MRQGAGETQGATDEAQVEARRGRVRRGRARWGETDRRIAMQEWHAGSGMLTQIEFQEELHWEYRMRTKAQLASIPCERCKLMPL